jgi:hypothetical protein
MKYPDPPKPHLCRDCLADPNVSSPRDTDAACLICGVHYCAAHIGPHLANEHCCSLTLEHYSKSAPERRSFTEN